MYNNIGHIFSSFFFARLYSFIDIWSQRGSAKEHLQNMGVSCSRVCSAVKNLASRMICEFSAQFRLHRQSICGPLSLIYCSRNLNWFHWKPIVCIGCRSNSLRGFFLQAAMCKKKLFFFWFSATKFTTPSTITFSNTKLSSNSILSHLIFNTFTYQRSRWFR